MLDAYVKIYEDNMSDEEYKILLYLLDKFIKKVPICQGQCHKCQYESFSNVNYLSNNHCPLHITRDMLNKIINKPFDWNEVRG